MNKIKYINTQGFTLIELLVVVIIIAILAAVAVPQYKKAALKSRFSTVMPMAKSIADAQEVYYQGRQMYALDVDELDVTPVTAENTSVAISDEDGFDYVLGSRSDIPGAAYVIYQKHSGQFPGAVMCEANETLNPLSTWLCRDSLKGEEMSGSLQGEGWTAYLISGSNVGRFGTAADEIRKTCNQTEGCSATVNPQTNEVTTTQCDTSARSNTIITYDEEGNQTGYRKEKCSATSYAATWDNCTCVPLNQNSRMTPVRYLEVLDENNNVIGAKTCVYMENGKCTYKTYTNRVGDVFYHNTRFCAVEEDTDTCSLWSQQTLAESSNVEYEWTTKTRRKSIWCNGTVSEDRVCSGDMYIQIYPGGAQKCSSYQSVNWDDLTCS